MISLKPTFQVNKPKVYAQNQSMDFKSQLQMSWKDTSEIDKKVEQEIQDVKSKTITIDDFYDRVDQVKEKHGLEDEQAYIKSLSMAKDRWYIVEWLVLDSELQTFWEFAQEDNVDTPSEDASIDDPISKPESKTISFMKWVRETGDNYVWGAISKIPNIAWNIGSWILSISGRLWWVDKETREKVEQETRKLWEKWEKEIQDFFSIDSDSKAAKAWGFSSEMLSIMAWPWKFTAAWKMKNIDKIQEAYNKLWPKTKKIVGIIGAWIRWAEETAKFNIIDEWELNKSDIGVGAWIWAALPIAWWLVNKWTSVIDSWVKKILQTFWRFDDATVKQIENNPELVKKVLKGKISINEIEKTLKTQFKNQADVDAILDKTKELLINKYKSYAVKGKETQKDIVENEVMDLLTWKISSKSKIWQEFQEFLTDDVVWVQDDLLKMIDDIPWISKEWDTIIWQDARQAYEEISWIIKSYFTKEWGANLTQKKLRSIEQAINAKANPTQAWTKKTSVQNIMSNYAKKVSDFAEEKIPWLKESSEKYREATQTVKEIQSLVTKWWNSMEVRDSLFWSLTNILKNPTKLKKVKDVFWDEIEWKLKTIEEWLVFEKAMDQIASIKSWSSFLQKLKTWTSLQRNIPFKKTVENKLKEVSKTEEQANFLKKIFKEDLWEETIGNIPDATISNIRKYGIAQKNKEITELADVLEIVKWLWGKQTSDISVAAASSAAWQAAMWRPWQAAMFLFWTSKKTLSDIYSAYYKASSSLRGWKAKIQSPSNDELRDFVRKTIIYLNINE